jgi:sortase B
MCRDFFRISTFSFSSASSFSFCLSSLSSSLFRCISSLSDTGCLGRIPFDSAYVGILCFRRYSLTHLHTVFTSIPISSAKLVADFPFDSISLAVCSLISSVYFELLLGIEFPFLYAYGNATHCTFLAAGQFKRMKESNGRAKRQVKKSYLMPVIIGLIIVGIFASFFAMAMTIRSSKANADHTIAIVPSPVPSLSPTVFETPIPDSSLVIAAKQQAAKNPETTGWIRIEGTRVDYPVVQAKDNSYYLTHDSDRSTSKYGAVFLDYRCNPKVPQRNNILYGHNMKDGSMFASLMQYKDKKYFDAHPIIETSTLTNTLRWEIFAVFITSTNYNYIQTDFTDDSQFLSFLNKMQGKSLFKTDYSPKGSDTILILSTCTYEYNDARFAVAARLL